MQMSGHAMHQSSFLNTCSYKVCDQNGFVRAAVFAEMRKGVQYIVECRISDQEIVYTACECTAGRGPNAICKHVAVVLYALEHYERTGMWKTAKSCTDNTQAWPLQPKKRVLDPGDPKTPAEILGINPAECNYLADPRPPSMRGIDVEQKRPRLEMMLVNFAAFRSDRLHLHEICKGGVNMNGVINDHDYFEDELPDVWLSRATNLTEEEGRVLEEKTRGQASCTLWKEERRLRLTASTCHRICHIKNNEEDLAKNMLEERSLDHIPAVKWGKVNERDALNKYEYETGRKVKKCGLFVSHELPFLAASPDGISDDRLIEVKCPFKKEIRESRSLIQAGYPPLKVNANNKPTLKDTHPYYSQVQLQMYVTRYHVCDFVVYTPIDICIVEVHRDQPFIDTMVRKLTKFYHDFYKPSLVRKLYMNGQ